MAEVTIYKSEMDSTLPRTCIHCGEPGNEWKEKLIQAPEKDPHTSGGHDAGWIGLVFLLVDLARWFSGPYIWIRIPFCAAHYNKLFRQKIAVLLGFGSVILTWAVALVLVLTDASKAESASNTALVVTLGLFVLFFLVHGSTIWTYQAVSADSVKFFDVSEQFAEALAKQRQSEVKQ